MSIDKSFYSLIKYNNGFFKSEKQAKFLLSHCEDNLYSVSGLVYRNSYLDVFECDDRGVVKADRYTENGQKIKSIFVRDDSVSMDDLAAKKEKFLKNKERIAVINHLHSKWMEKKENLSPMKKVDVIMSIINEGRMDDVKALLDRLNEVCNSIDERVSRICEIRDQLVTENCSR